MRKILVGMPYSDAHKAYIEEIGKGCTFVYKPLKEQTEEDVRDAEVIFGNTSVELVKKAEKLRWMQLNSAGADQYCKEGVLQPQVQLTCATGAYGLAVSEVMLTMTLMLTKKMDLYGEHQKAHVWKDEGHVSSVMGSTMIIIGAGDIGGEYAKKMKALGSYCIGFKRHVKEKPEFLDEVYTLDRLEEMLPRADYVALALPNTPETTHLMNLDRMKQMKKSAFLINAGRGSAVDNMALNEALRDGLIAGAALDVTDPEPLPADHPLWDAPHFILTPHSAGKFNLSETFERIVRRCGGNLQKYLSEDGDHMEGIVDRATGYRRI